MFSQRLDFMMNLSNSSNIDLARATGIDASAVSRLRTGKRELSKNHFFLPEMCAYFARNLPSEHQKMAAADIICPGKIWPEDHEAASDLIGNWLLKSNDFQLSCVEDLLKCVSQLRFPTVPEMKLFPLHEQLEPEHYYYGTDGFREAVITLLDYALSSGSPRTIYIFSDENDSWLNGDHDFSEIWSQRLKKLIFLGCKVFTIKNTSRPLDEQLSSISRWMPLYITGAVEPYYCPKIRDGVYHRTLLIVKGLVALQTSSVAGIKDQTLTHLLTEQRAVAALELEYSNYLELCRPAIKVFCEADAFTRQLVATDYGPGKYYFCCTTPSLPTMPFNVAERISFRSGSDSFLKLSRNIKEVYNLMDGNRQYWELISIPTDRQIADDNIPIGTTKLLGFTDCYYTVKEYSAHIKSIIAFSRQHKNYHFTFTKNIPRNTAVYGKIGRGAVVIKCDRPCISFGFYQPATGEAICNYLYQQYEISQSNFTMHRDISELLMT